MHQLVRNIRQPPKTLRMRFEAEPLTLNLRTPFRIAHGTSTARTNVLVRLGEAMGEGALPPYYGVTADEACAYVEGLDLPVPEDGTPPALEHLLDRLPDGPAAARAAVDLALHDLWGRRLGQPLYRLWGLLPDDAPPSSYTLSIPDHLGDFPDVIAAAPPCPVLKLKLGAGTPEADEAIVRTARRATDKPLCVDANGAWSVEEAAVLVPRLAAYDLLFIEQPLPTGDAQAWHALRRRLPARMPPLYADESIQDASDVLALRGAIDGINVKLAKNGGLRGARRLITLARALGMGVLLGCMVESAVALTAAAHLAPLADYADLDAVLLVADDPFDGVTLDRGYLRLPDRPGIGVR